MCFAFVFRLLAISTRLPHYDQKMSAKNTGTQDEKVVGPVIDSSTQMSILWTSTQKHERINTALKSHSALPRRIVDFSNSDSRGQCSRGRRSFRKKCMKSVFVMSFSARALFKYLKFVMNIERSAIYIIFSHLFFCLGKNISIYIPRLTTCSYGDEVSSLQ